MIARSLFVAAGLALAPTLALADATDGQVVATAGPPPPQPAPQGVVVSTIPVASVQPVERTPPRDSRVHGSATVGVGTRGDREGEVRVEGPLGPTGYGSITVGAAQDGPWRR